MRKYLIATAAALTLSAASLAPQPAKAGDFFPGFALGAVTGVLAAPLIYGHRPYYGRTYYRGRCHFERRRVFIEGVGWRRRAVRVC